MKMHFRNKKETVFIAGLGEVGDVIKRLAQENFKKVYWNDPIRKEVNLPNKNIEINYLHICFPFKEQKEFIKEVINYQKKLDPDFIIIHSTVGVGTTKRILSEIIYKCRIAHSPIRGNHNDMYNHVKSKFIKFVGANTPYTADKVCKHLTDLGIHRAKWLGIPETTELGKLLSTSWYGINIAFQQEMERMCKYYRVDFDRTVWEFTKDGFFDSNHKYRRPRMFPGFIKGHCVIPNFRILLKNYESSFIRNALESNEKKGRGK